RFPELLAGKVVHLVVNSRPDSRIAAFLADGTNEVGMRGKQIGEYLGARGRERGVIRRVTREIGNWTQWVDCRIVLMRSEVPGREFAVLASDKSIEHRSRNQCIYARGARWILIQPILEHPFVGISKWPGLKTFGALPIKCLIVRHECSRKVADGRRLSEHLAR